ncbi:DUF2059 domain-containing protein [Dokdonella sp.]|uniref:DUF2059 domain-containing protein n=1 Tax=Dokdonella sp. TaxID=2291710 RepID=UPI003C32F17B
MFRTRILVFLVALCAIPTLAVAEKTTPAAPPTDEKITLSIELMRVMNFDQTMRTMQSQMRGMMEQQFESFAKCPSAQPVMREYSGALTDQIMGNLMDESLKVDVAAIYADVFTVEELRGIVDFYHSPIGRKMVERMPELMEKSMLITQDRVKAMVPELESLSERYASRIREAAKTCEQDSDATESSTEE